MTGVGASAGGVGALQRLFETLPADTGAAFVVIVHLDPRMRSELPEILAMRSKMPAHQVTETTALKPNCIYVIPPDRELRISDDTISVAPFTEPRGKRAPIDHFFRSLAEQHGDGFAVILTGAGSDGAVGVKAVKEAGGIILVQDPEEAEYPSMPRAAIATDMADFVLPVRDLAQRLTELIKLKARPPDAPRPGQEDALRRILALVRSRTGHDFAHYKRSTITRRVLRRMQLSRQESLEDYFTFLRDNGQETQPLMADLLISVTTFFRDPKAFEVLAARALPALFSGGDAKRPIRVWVAGCASGEEAFSLAMLLLEEQSRHDLRRDVQVFASDMDPRALAAAREGCYPTAIEADVSDERLRRFFIREGDFYRAKRELRDTVVFASHSVLRDPPFSRIDLISCRNLLIYLDRELQQQVLATLHYGLTPTGYLFLGSSETAEHRDRLFTAVDHDARLFQSTGRTNDQPLKLPRITGTPTGDHRADATRMRDPAHAAYAAHRQALEADAPASVLVDESNRVINLSETAGRFLQPSAGPLTSDLTELVRLELRFELRSALTRAFEHNMPVLTEPMPVRFNGDARRVQVQVRPRLPDPRGPRQAVVLFLEGDAVPAPGKGRQRQRPDGEGAADRLRDELDLTQARLRITREESEAANEELRAANEELLSTNEEYRSTAEELETSREELQSINEELQTVNSELKLKLETAAEANSDLQNLIAATDFATLFLDTHLRIKRFTPRLADLFSVAPGDVGRSITDFAHQLDYEDLAEDARGVLEDLIPIEREVRTRGGHWHLVRFRPYRTLENKIDGVVVTFVDISERRAMEDALRESEGRARQEMRLVEVSHAPMLVWDIDDGVAQWNRGSEELYGYSRDEVMGADVDALLKTTVPGSSLQAVREALLKDGAWKGEFNRETRLGAPLNLDCHLGLLVHNRRRYVLESVRDITESQATIERQRLLLSELTHRIRNILTVTQAMIHQTWRNSPTPEAFIERVNGRVAALANAHRLLVGSEWEGAELKDIVDSQLAPYLGNDAGRATVSGERVRLPAGLANPLGLVIHELTTNAVKHGALSNPTGTVDLSWRMAGTDGARRLFFRWSEHGGPQVTPPVRHGLGSQLIDHGVPGSKVRHAFLADGVVCEIEAPLPE
ncbi:MAG TPA: chemotaxis protein CheB [Caulobacteraceae bacterium]|nr:chemotaxis protein CheB [Caulobacteraceae bacterium]